MSEILQAVIDGLAIGAVVALATLGMTVLLRVGRIFDLAIGEMVIAGAALSTIATESWGLPSLVAVGVAIAGIAVASGAIGTIVIEPLRRGGAGPIGLVIGTAAVALIVRGGVSLGTQSPLGLSPSDPVGTFGSVEVSAAQAIAVAGVLLLGVLLLLAGRTTLGKHVRATGDDPELAATVGIDLRRLRMTAWVLSGLGAGAAGATLATLEPTLTTSDGTAWLLAIAAASALGRARSIGAIAAGLTVGVSIVVSNLLTDGDHRVVASFAIVVIAAALSQRAGAHEPRAT